MRLKALTALALLGIALVTLTPRSRGHVLHLVPFSDIGSALAHPRSEILAAGVVGNVLLFVPLGALLRLQGFRTRRAIVVGLALSVSIELAQLAIPGRTTSTDDVLLNTSGAAIGCVVVGALVARGRSTRG